MPRLTFHSANKPNILLLTGFHSEGFLPVYPDGSAVKRRLSMKIFHENNNAQTTFSTTPNNLTTIPVSKHRFLPYQHENFPRDFLVSAVYAGVKTALNSTIVATSNTSDKGDIALVHSIRDCVCAAVFTQNRFPAAPVIVSRENLISRNGHGLRSVIINSGCANAVTGRDGLRDAKLMCETVDKCFANAAVDETSNHSLLSFTQSLSRSLVMSTGVIGQKLPINRILSAIPHAVKNLGCTYEHWFQASRAICTTDTFPKFSSRQATLPSSNSANYRIAGMAKGSGMIHPNMATMLSVICTDLSLTVPAAKQLLAHAVKHSFNCISIDGDTSTNDTVVLLANGAAETPLIDLPSSNSSDSAHLDYFAVEAELTSFAQNLAQLIVRDGEGATKFVRINVTGALNDADAHRIAENIAKSPLVKAALYGKDANWGRILCAIGYTPNLSSSSSILPGHTSVRIASEGVPKKGDDTESKTSAQKGKLLQLDLLVDDEPVPAVDEQKAAQILEATDIIINVSLARHELAKERLGRATYWTCDLSHDYVSINADYRT